MKKVYVIINQQHNLLPDQARVLENKFPVQKDYDLEFFLVPSKGWTQEEIRDIADELWATRPEAIIFVSPIPSSTFSGHLYLEYQTQIIASCPSFLLLIKLFSRWAVEGCHEGNNFYYPDILIFHNDHREKKELPDGKIITTVAREGWILV